MSFCTAELLPGILGFRTITVVALHAQLVYSGTEWIPETLDSFFQFLNRAWEEIDNNTKTEQL